MLFRSTALTIPVDPGWAYLAGANGAGKTWVWATGIPSEFVWGGGEFVDEFWEEFELGDLKKDGFWDDKELDFWEEYYDNWDEIDEETMEHWFGAFYNEMTLKFDGSANFSLLVKESDEDPGESQTDKFVFDVKNKTLSNINKTPFLWSPWHNDNVDLGDIDLDGQAEISTYEILKLTADELVLSFEDDHSEKRFIWFLKRKGYEYE